MLQSCVQKEYICHSSTTFTIPVSNLSKSTKTVLQILGQKCHLAHSELIHLSFRHYYTPQKSFVRHELYSEYHCLPLRKKNYTCHFCQTQERQDKKFEERLAEKNKTKNMKYIKCSFNGSFRSTVKLKLCSSQAWKKNKDDR